MKMELLGELAEIKQGYTFKPKYQGQKGKKWPYIKVADVGSPKNNKYLSTYINSVDDAVLDEMNVQPFESGSIVFPRVGAALRNNNKRILVKDSLADDNVIVITVKQKERCYNEYLYYWFISKDLARFCNDGLVPVINAKNLKTQKVGLPPLLEQKAIANSLSMWDEAIEKTGYLITAKEKRFQYFLTLLINDTSHPHGHIRDFTIEVSTRNRSNQCERVLSVTNSNGFVLPEDQFERRVASANLSNYKIVEHGQYAYNPSRINVGSIARLDNWDEGVLSPMYVVFKLDDKKVNSDFFLHWLSSHEARERIKRSAQGSVRETVSFADLGTIPFPLPDMDIQSSVVEILNTAKKEIDLLKQLAEQYRKQKRGLMQKLLTGEWRVNTDKEVA